jgi:hypothetical protein
MEIPELLRFFLAFLRLVAAMVHGMAMGGREGLAAALALVLLVVRQPLGKDRQGGSEIQTELITRPVGVAAVPVELEQMVLLRLVGLVE